MIDEGKRNIKRLGRLLLEKETITQLQLEQALKEQKNTQARLGEILIALEFVNEEDILIALTTQYGYPYLPLENCQIDKETARIIPVELARKYCLIPIDRIGHVLTVAMSDPLDEEALKAVEESTGYATQVFVSPRSDVIKAIKDSY